MNNRKYSNLLSTLCALIFLLTGKPAFGAVTTWTGSSFIDINWSTGGNWDTTLAPGALDPVRFGTFGVTNAVGAVNNIVDTTTQVTNLFYQTLGTAGFHTTFINPGVSLNIVGTGTGTSYGTNAALFVGTATQLPATADSSTYRIVGPGTLAVTNPGSSITVVNMGGAADHYATLNLSGLTNFVADVGQLVVGGSTNAGEASQMGVMLLAETNFIHVGAGTLKPGIVVASQNNGSTVVRGTQQLFLGKYNNIQADAISIGGTKMTGQLLFRTGLSNGVALIRGSAGGSDRVKFFSVGDEKAGIDNYIPGTTSVGNSGSFDGTGNVLDILATDFYVARSQTNAAGATTGTLTFDTGTIDANNFYVGFHPAPAAASQSYNATGTVNVNGNGTITVNNDLLLSRKVGTAVPVATLNLAGNALVNVKGNIVSSNGTSTINFSGGTVNMQPSGDGSPGDVTVATLSGTGGAIINANNVTNTSLFTPGTQIGGGSLSIAANNFVLPSTSTALWNIADVTTIGSGVNDYLSVTGNITLAGAIVFVPLNTTLANGTYRLIDFTGARTGTFLFSNPTRYTASMDYLANQVNVTVGGSSGSVRWNSASSALWDLTTSNWFNTGTAAVDRFFQLDTVLADDTGSATNLLLLSTQMFPGGVTVNSSARNYSFGGAGRISGAAGITKLGTSTLTVSNANDFYGPVAIGGGVLRVANTSALGTTAGVTFATNGGTLDINGLALNNPGEIVMISGNGLNSTGAVMNAGVQQTAGLRYVTLVGDGSIGAWGTRWDIRGTGGAGSFNGEVNLNGFTFTKVGGNALFLTDCTVTNAGSFDVFGGTLAFARTIVDGPGTINARSNIVSFESSSVGYNTKPVIVSGGTIRNAANAYTLFAPVTNVSGLTIDAATALTFTNVIVGAGGVTKISAANVTYLAANTYTGPTVVSAGTLTIGTNSSLATSSGITVGAAATLDVTAISGFTLSSGQTLGGSGNILGNVVANSSNTLFPGSSPGTLSFNNNVTLNGVSNVFELGSDPTQIGGGQNDLVASGGPMVLTGTIKIKIQPVAPLSDATPYTLFMSTNSLDATAATFQITSDNPRYTFTLVDPNTTPGVIQVQVSGVPTTLTWRGAQPGNPTTWNGTVSNWLNGISLDSFFSGDSVKFDDSALTNLVTIPGQLTPGSITVSNETQLYRFGGAAGFSAGAFVKQGASSVTFTNSGLASFSAGMTVSAGDVRVANGSTNNLGGIITVNSGSLTFANPANNFGSGITLNGGTLALTQAIDHTLSTPIMNDVINVAGTLVKSGNNTLTLSGNNLLYDGPIQVNAGVLRAGNANALGTGFGGTTIASGAMLDINGFAMFNTDVVTISGFGTNGAGAINNSGAQQLNAIKGVTLAADAAIGASGNRYDIRGPGGVGSFSGTLDMNNFKLTKVGPGTVFLTDANLNNAGLLEVAAGTMAFARSSVPAAGLLHVSNNVVEFNAYTAGSFAMPILINGGIMRLSANNTFPFTSPITNLAGGLTIDTSATAAFAIGGTITGPGTLTKIGTGVAILGAPDSTWTGITTISAGSLQIGTGGPDGSLPDLPVTNNGTLIFDSQNNFTLTKPIDGTGGVIQGGGGLVSFTVSNSYAGTTILTNITLATSADGGALRISNNDALGSTAGNTIIVGGSLNNCRLEVLGNITVPENFQFGGHQGQTADTPHILNVSGSNTLSGSVIVGTTGGTEYNLRSDSGKLVVGLGFSPPNTAADRRLKLLGPADGEWTGSISNSPNGLVPAILVKSNAGTWTLSSANYYTGPTTIQEGVLALGAFGSIANTPTIDVGSAGTFNVAAVSGGYVLGPSQTLKGNGNVVGNVTANGTVTPGTSIGTLTFANNLVLAGTTTMEIDRNGGTPLSDLVNANNLTYGGTLVVNNIGATLQLGDTFNLFDWTTRSGSFGSTVLPTLDPGLGWDLSNLAVNGTIIVSTGPATNPTNLTFTASGGALTISWPPDHIGWRLQGQTNAPGIGVTTNWATVAGSTTTNQVILPLDRALGSSFYRLIYP